MLSHMLLDRLDGNFSACVKLPSNKNPSFGDDGSPVLPMNCRGAASAACGETSTPSNSYQIKNADFVHAQKGKYLAYFFPWFGSDGLILPASVASAIIREALAAFLSSIPNRFRNVVFVRRATVF
jgi:hypothetical protein